MKNKKLIITIAGVLVALFAVQSIFAWDFKDSEHNNLDYKNVDLRMIKPH